MLCGLNPIRAELHKDGGGSGTALCQNTRYFNVCITKTTDIIDADVVRLPSSSSSSNVYGGLPYWLISVTSNISRPVHLCAACLIPALRFTFWDAILMCNLIWIHLTHYPAPNTWQRRALHSSCPEINCIHISHFDSNKQFM